MTRLFLLLLLALSACRDEAPPRIEGPYVYVLFDERHGLEGGEPVRLHEFEIGFVEGVDLAQARVRAKLVIEPAIVGQLTEASTFSVVGTGERYLEGHVVDPDAPPLTEGATLEGVDSAWELASRRLRGTASWKKASDVLDEIEREVDAIDWNEEEEDLRKRLDEAMGEMQERAAESYEEAAKDAGEIAKELEELGRSEEAQRLRERLQELLDELRSQEPH